MGESEKTKPETINSFQDRWNNFRQMMEREGISLGAVWWKLIVEQFQWLSTSASRKDFEELCGVGCAPIILASIIGLIRLVPRVEISWELWVGDADKRRKTTTALEQAATALEEVFGDIIAGEDESQRQDLAKVGCLPPSRLVSQIRFYVSMLNLAELGSEKFDVYSLKEFTKYLLVGYVNRATGRFCDRPVSGIIGEIIGPRDYDETALRMWRSRNYQRLDNHLSGLPDFFLDIGKDITALLT